MPRPRREGAPEPKKRSRFGCWPCKRRRIKCGEEKPACANCVKVGEDCDYSVRLNWDGRSRRPIDDAEDADDNPSSPSTTTFPSSVTTPASYQSASSTPAESSSSAKPLANANLSRRSKQGKFVYLFDGRTQQTSVNVPAQARSPALDLTINTSPDVYMTDDSDDARPEMSTALHQQLDDLNALQDAYAAVDRGKNRPGAFMDDFSTGTLYGFDQGLPDADVPSNGDATALLPLYFSHTKTAQSLHNIGTQHQDRGDPRFNAEEYYKSPIPVIIPRSLEPLPPLLAQNPMNLLYFHYFLDHSSRILVPCDCPANMLRTEIPRLARLDDTLLRLILAYSAYHRARLLGVRHPKNRMAMLLEGVFGQLRLAIEAGSEALSIQAVCVSLFMVSIELVAPDAFETPEFGWENYLKLARRCMMMKGGINQLQKSGPLAKYCVQWFAYFDVAASLCSPTYGAPMVRAGIKCEMEGHIGCGHPAEKLGDPNHIECYLDTLDLSANAQAEVAYLIHAYCGGRLRPDKTVFDEWRPLPEVEARAHHLVAMIQSTKHIPDTPCRGDTRDSRINPEAIVLSFYEAALIHLNRRVLNRPTKSKEVQDSVATIISRIEMCEDRSAVLMTMPLVTAALEAVKRSHRLTALRWLSRIENVGFVTAGQGRDLAIRVYETGQNWEALWKGEYIGV